MASEDVATFHIHVDSARGPIALRPSEQRLVLNDPANARPPSAFALSNEPLSKTSGSRQAARESDTLTLSAGDGLRLVDDVPHGAVEPCRLALSVHEDHAESPRVLAILFA